MGIQQTLSVINEMEADKIIGRYAITGAIAAYNYVEAAVTDDLDILVSFDRAANQAGSGLITLTPIYSYLKQKGYDDHRKEGILIKGWPVQFLPVANPLDAEALERADEIEIQFPEGEGPVRSRVLRPEHVVATALRVGRAQDLIRISQFLNENAVKPSALCAVLARHGLGQAWRQFCTRAGIADPCRVEDTP